MNAENEGASTLSPNYSSFTDDMLYLLKQGGMMQIAHAYLFEEDLYLLSPPVKAQPYFCYNYFDDAFQDDAVLHPAEGKLGCRAPGNGNFERIMYAAHRLLELRKQPVKGSAVTIDTASPFPDVDGWLNYLFQASNTSPNPWQLYQSAPPSEWKEDLVKAAWKCEGTQQFILNDCFGPLVSQDEQLLAAEYENRFPPFMPVAVLRNAEESIYCIRMSAGTQGEKFKFMREVLTGHRADAAGLPPCYHMFMTARDTVPVEILLPMIAKEFKLDEKSLQEEFDPSSFRVPAFSLYQSHLQSRVIPTTEFLHVSDDDRAYYWTHDGNVSFSPEMKAWLSSLKKEYQSMISSDGNILPALKFTLLLFSTLENINCKFREIYAFKDMLSDYLKHVESREYQAAWFVLCRLAQYQGGDFIPYDGPWELAPLEFRNHPARLAVKRYLAILANRELRREVFGF